jgi:hypothetical protein
MADRSQCKYFEACGLHEVSRVGDDLYCILHLPPGPAKDVSTFNAALAACINGGRSDFRWVYFPEQNPPSLRGNHFAGVVDLRDATVAGMLDLTESVCDRDVLLGGASIQGVNLSKVKIGGNLHYDGTIANTFRMFNAVIEGSTDLRFETLAHVEADMTEFRGRLTVQGPAMASLDLNRATIRRGLTLRGRYNREHGGTKFGHASMQGPLDFRGVDFDVNLSFPEVVFDTTSTLDLRGARVRGTFTLGDLPVVPKEVSLDGARFDDVVRIDGPAGGPKPRVIAFERRPTFGRAVSLTNVDAQDLLIAGNVVQTIAFWNVDWPRRRGRYVLRDEIIYRRSKSMPASNLREAYQVLKRKYEDKGDHIRAGDFHYGEMEMKRREYGFPRRWLSWEFAYWMLSGYGVGHIRSLVILIALIIGFGAAYYLTKPEAFTGFSEALRYSVGVAALQRPEMPAEFGEPQRWLHVTEAVLGPLQIALFVLALRMRLKR